MRTLDLIQNLLINQLKLEAEDITSILRQGFNLHVHTEFPEVALTLSNLLRAEAENLPHTYHVLQDINMLNSKPTSSSFLPTVLIGNQTLPQGSGFARYTLASPDKIIGKPATAVRLILNEFNLTDYIDSFDGKIFSRLKDIAKTLGVYALIDAVVQTAFLAGMKGEQDRALYFLNQFQSLWEKEHMLNDAGLLSCGKRFLSHCISYGNESMDFLKASLCFYVVNQQGRSMTQASEILNISRTTLAEYLKCADKLNVSHFFNC